MKNLREIAESTYTAWLFVVGLSLYWHYRIELEVPKPYLVCQSVFPLHPKREGAKSNCRMNSSTFSKLNYTSKDASTNGIPR